MARTASKKAAKRPEPRGKSMPARTPEEYLATLPPDRRQPVGRLREVLRENLPEGFEETIDYGMLSYVVPHSLLGLYEGPLLAWFRTAWPKHTGMRLDLGKCCLRLNNLDEIPYGLIGELAGRMTPHQWIEAYEAARGNR